MSFHQSGIVVPSEVIYLVAPVDILALYVGREFRRAADTDGLVIGVPIVEAEGVPDRRAYVAHRFTPGQLAFAVQTAKAYGHDRLVSVLTAVPDDWRAPPVVTAATLAP